MWPFPSTDAFSPLFTLFLWAEVRFTPVDSSCIEEILRYTFALLAIFFSMPCHSHGSILWAHELHFSLITLLDNPSDLYNF